MTPSGHGSLFLFPDTIMSINKVSLPASSQSPLTVEDFRSYPGCEKYSDEDAADIIESLDVLARVFLQAAILHGTHYDNQADSSIGILIQGNTVHKRAA